MKNNRQKTTKMLAAVIGGSAGVTMGALAMSFQQAQQPVPAQHLAVGVMTVGATETASGVADTAVATSMAVPAIKGPAPLPTEEQSAE